MKPLTLTPEELYDLTHYKRASDQIVALRHMGIDHYVRPDGTPAVLRATLEGHGKNEKPEEEVKLNLDAV